MTLFRQPGLLLAVGLLLGLQTSPTDANQLKASPGFAPVPVFSIYPPRKAQGTADDALASGTVQTERFVPAAPASKPWRVAYLFPHLKDPYWIGCNYGLMSEARRLGLAVDVFTADGYDDLIGQLRQMDGAISARYDAIVLSPLSLTGNNSSIAKARAAGIPVFELANDSTSDDLTLKVTTSLKGMGLDAMQWVIRDAQRRGLKVINIGLLPGPVDAGWVKGEVEGTLEAVSKSPITVNVVDIQYGDSDRIVQSRLAAHMLAQSGRTLDYILGCTGCAPAAVLPVKEAGLSGRITIVAYDLTREIVGLIRQGAIAAAVDTKGASQARVVTNAVVNYLEGRSTKMPHTILIKLGLVDQNTLARYPLDASAAPEGFTPVLSVPLPRMR